MVKPRSWQEVLRFGSGAPQATLRRHFITWRRDHGVPLRRCDIPECRFFTEPLVWNGKPVGLVLDHRDGDSSDNSAENLRFLCPNCNAQQPTFAGGNKGRVTKLEGGSIVRNREDGTTVAKSTGRAEGTSTASAVFETRHEPPPDGSKPQGQ